MFSVTQFEGDIYTVVKVKTADIMLHFECVFMFVVCVYVTYIIIFIYLVSFCFFFIIIIMLYSFLLLDALHERTQIIIPVFIHILSLRLLFMSRQNEENRRC